MSVLLYLIKPDTDEPSSVPEDVRNRAAAMTIDCISRMPDRVSAETNSSDS